MKTAYSLLFWLLLFVGSSFAQSSEIVRVTILHLNDTYQFTAADGGKRGGLARVMTIKKEALKENPNTILTLGGDTLSPSVETRTYKGVQMIDAWNTGRAGLCCVRKPRVRSQDGGAARTDEGVEIHLAGSERDRHENRQNVRRNAAVRDPFDRRREDRSYRFAASGNEGNFFDGSPPQRDGFLRNGDATWFPKCATWEQR